jgi:hypothetical protein
MVVDYNTTNYKEINEKLWRCWSLICIYFNKTGEDNISRVAAYYKGPILFAILLSASQIDIGIGLVQPVPPKELY